MKKVLALLCLPVLLASSFSISLPGTSSAVTASDWKPGRIIDDGLFTYASDMSVADIQNFLNARTPNCDTWGTGIATEFGSRLTRAQYAASRGWPGPPYVCLKNYHEVPKNEPSPGIPANSFRNGGNPPAGSISAAQMIYNAAQRYQINPKTLLVTIHKESAGPLTTDIWPLEKQYTYAMGAYCPDSGPGGSANCDPNYAGFSIQIAQSARLMRYYLDNMQQPWWTYKKPFQTNSILWNVAQTGCGAGNVYIETKATAALYTYTPYQPNQAALNNMYGTGDGCSAYGNRNFWRIWNDWFGSTIGAGYSFVDAQNAPLTMFPNQPTEVSISVRNESGKTWFADGSTPQGASPTRLMTIGYKDSPFANRNDSRWLGTKNQVRMLQPSVANGDIATFAFSIKGAMQGLTNYEHNFTIVTDGIKVYPSIGLQWKTSTPIPDYSYEVIGNRTAPPFMQPGSTFDTLIMLRNSGNIWWNSEASSQALRLTTWSPAYHSSSFYDNSDDNWLSPGQIRLRESSVPPGGQGSFMFRAKAPLTEGTYSDQLIPVIDGVGFYPFKDLSISTKSAMYSYQFIDKTMPRTLKPGEITDGVIHIRNTGSSIWYADGNVPAGHSAFRLASAAYINSPFAVISDPAWLGTKNQLKMLTPVVGPGEIAEFRFKVGGSYRHAGSYVLNLVPVIDGIRWLDNTQQLGSTISIDTPRFSYSFVRAEGQVGSLLKNQSVSTKLFVKNTGNGIWYSDDNNPLGIGSLRMVMINPVYRDSLFSRSSASWLGTRSQIKMVTPVVDPGEVAEFAFDWTSPPATGVFTDRFSLVSDGITILPDTGMQFVTTVR